MARIRIRPAHHIPVLTNGESEEGEDRMTQWVVVLKSPMLKEAQAEVNLSSKNADDASVPHLYFSYQLIPGQNSPGPG